MSNATYICSGCLLCGQTIPRDRDGDYCCDEHQQYDEHQLVDVHLALDEEEKRREAGDR